MSMPKVSDRCSSTSSVTYSEPGTYCPPLHDRVSCWPATLANTTAQKLCKELVKEFGLALDENSTLKAYKVCLPNGQWKNGTDYTACLAAVNVSGTTESPGPTDGIGIAGTLTMIIFVSSLVSVVVLLIALFIFMRFKSLQCHRTTIHKNLIISFILRFLTHILMTENYVFGHSAWYREHGWLCRTMVSVQQLSFLANFCWMLVEGLYLHLILVLRPLNNGKAPFLLFYFIGWVVPIMITVTWAVIMHFEHEDRCWDSYVKTSLIFIIYGPIMFTMFINLIILMNLVRIVIAKLCSGQSTERRKICRTIKSTVFLVFLLGIINLQFIFSTDNPNSSTNIIYRYVSALLPQCQGIFVALIYCAFNSEVQRAVKKHWSRFRASRDMNYTGYRRRSSKTSVTYYVSRETTQSNGIVQTSLL